MSDADLKRSRLQLIVEQSAHVDDGALPDLADALDTLMSELSEGGADHRLVQRLRSILGGMEAIDAVCLDEGGTPSPTELDQLHDDADSLRQVGRGRAGTRRVAPGRPLPFVEQSGSLHNCHPRSHGCSVLVKAGLLARRLRPPSPLLLLARDMPNGFDAAPPFVCSARHSAETDIAVCDEQQRVRAPMLVGRGLPSQPRV